MLNLTILLGLIGHFPYCDQESFSNHAQKHLRKVVSTIQLNGRLGFVGGPSTETFETIKSTYVAPTQPELAMDFLKKSIESQAYNLDGSLNPDAPYIKFTTALPSSWTDSSVLDNDLCVVKYEIKSTNVVVDDKTKTLRFQYHYSLSIDDIQNGSIPLEKSGRFEVKIEPAAWRASAAFASNK